MLDQCEGTESLLGYPAWYLFPTINTRTGPIIGETDKFYHNFIKKILIHKKSDKIYEKCKKTKLYYLNVCVCVIQ